ncbi:MAG: hypothetical protein IKT30_06835 [Bacteroidaceae bacterium]|nr:hypothetical protein [Bacteroidaceae bacterium]
MTDITTLWRPLTAAETTRAEALLLPVSDELRTLAHDVGKDMDAMVSESEVYANVVRVVTVDVVSRVLRQSTEGDAMTQESQSALGYSWSGTYAVPGGGIANAIMKNDLRKLGLLNQTIGVMYTWQGSGASV